MKSKKFLAGCFALAAGALAVPLAKAEVIAPEAKVMRYGAPRGAPNARAIRARWETQAFAQNGAENEIAGTADLKFRFLGRRIAPLQAAVRVLAAKSGAAGEARILVVYDGKTLVDEADDHEFPVPMRFPVVRYPVKRFDATAGGHAFRIRGAIELKGNLDADLRPRLGDAHVSMVLGWGAYPEVHLSAGSGARAQLSTVLFPMTGNLRINSWATATGLTGYATAEQGGGDLVIRFLPTGRGPGVSFYNATVSNLKHTFWD